MQSLVQETIKVRINDEPGLNLFFFTARSNLVVYVFEWGKLIKSKFNPYVTNAHSYPYHLDESTFIFRGIRSSFSFLFHFSMNLFAANRIAPEGTPHFAASHLGLFYLPMSNKKDARLTLYMC